MLGRTSYLHVIPLMNQCIVLLQNGLLGTLGRHAQSHVDLECKRGQELVIKLILVMLTVKERVCSKWVVLLLHALRLVKDILFPHTRSRFQLVVPM